MSLNDLTYSQLAVLAGRLSMMAKKPISLGMAVSISTEIFDVVLNIPGVEEELKKKFSEISTKILSPEEFNIHWDEFFKLITGEKKK